MRKSAVELRHNCLNLMATEGKEAVEKYLEKESKNFSYYDCLHCDETTPAIPIGGDVSFCAFCGNVIDETEKVSFTESRTAEEEADALPMEKGLGLDLRGYSTNSIRGTKLFKSHESRMRYIKSYGLRIVNLKNNTNDNT